MADKKVLEYKDFEVMKINVYIVRRLYEQCKRKKGEKVKGSKAEFAKFIGADEKRIREMCIYSNMRKIHKKEAAKLEEEFGIDKGYFEISSKKLLNIGGATLDEWKYYLNTAEWGFPMKKILSRDDVKRITEKIERGFKESVEIVSDRYRSSDPVYKICYRFLMEVTYEGNTLIEIRNCIKDLENIKINDINRCDLKELDECIDRLEKRVEELKAIQIVRRLIKKQSENVT